MCELLTWIGCATAKKKLLHPWGPGRGQKVCLSVRLSVTLSPPKPLDELFNQILCVSCSHKWCVQRHNFLGPAPWAPGEGQKRSNIIKFQLHSQIQRFSNQTLCVFSQMKGRLGLAPGVGPWGTGGWGIKKLIFPKFNQVWYVSYSHKWHVQRRNFLGPRPLRPLGGAKKVKYHLNSITKSISKIFKSNFVSLLANERYIIYQTGYSFGGLGHAPGMGLGGTGRGGGGSKNYFFRIQPILVCELLT